MVRVQVQLDPTQHRLVRRRARRLGVSVAEMVRRCIDAALVSESPERREDRVRRALAVAGKYHDPHGARTLARDHDAALADSYRR